MRALFFKFVPLLMLWQFLLFSCKKEEIIDTPQTDSASIAKGEILYYMKNIYLWNNKIPDADTTDSKTIEDFYYSLLYRDLDLWSFIASTSEFTDYVNGVYYGHGFGVNTDEQGNFRISFVFKNTEAYKKGVARGYIIEAINGTKPLSLYHAMNLIGDNTSKTTNLFLFRKNNYEYEAISLSKEEVRMNMVLEQKVIQDGIKKIGYLAFYSFMGNALSELQYAFADFNKAQIDELVIDLRYNGGGELEIAHKFASAIASNNYGYEFCQLRFNNILRYYNYDTTYYFNPTPLALNKPLNRVFFITSNQTASASETLISGLQPYINCKIVGTRSNGKPVGMIPISLENADYVLVPIMFQMYYANGSPGLFSGIPVDQEEFDDLKNPLGDTSEACLAQVMSYINNDRFLIKSKSMPVYYNQQPLKGLKGLINAF